MTCSVGPPKSPARSRRTSEGSASEANFPKVLPLGSISRLLTSHCPTHEKSRKNLSSHAAAAASSLIPPPIPLPSAAQPPPSIHPSIRLFRRRRKVFLPRPSSPSLLYFTTTQNDFNGFPLTSFLPSSNPTPSGRNGAEGKRACFKIGSPVSRARQSLRSASALPRSSPGVSQSVGDIIPAAARH